MFKFKYLKIRLTNQNCMNHDNTSEVNVGNDRYHLVQYLLSSCLLCENMQGTVHKTIILTVICVNATLGPHIKERTWAENVGELGADDDI